MLELVVIPLAEGLVLGVSVVGLAMGLLAVLFRSSARAPRPHDRSPPS